MRKLLLAATAISAAATMTHAASAQTAGPKAPFTAVLDGSAVFTLGIPSATQNANHGRDLGMRQDADMRFKFEAKADNGLVYGWYVRIEGESSAVAVDTRSINREWLYLIDERWGGVQLGSASNPASSTFGGACGLIVPANYGPCGAPNQMGPDGGLEELLLTDPNAVAINGALSRTGGTQASAIKFATKIRYDSPKIAGFVFRFAYAPDGRQRNEEQFVTDTQGAAAITTSADQGGGYLGKFQNLIDTSLTWTGTIGPFTNMSGIDYTHGDPKDITFGTAVAKPINSVIVGTQLGFAGWTLGVAYNWAGESGFSNTVFQPGGAKPVQSWGMSAGLEYDFGPWQMGTWYQYARSQGAFATNGQIDLNYFGVGAGYTVAPGLKLFSEAFFYDDHNTHVTEAQNATSVGNPRNPNGQIYLAGLDLEW
jgi:outer membrane protein OmpU